MDSEPHLRVFDLGNGRKIAIEQELETDVGGVIWDSALVMAHYFILQGETFWTGRKVIEIGSGTGICGLILAGLGANVILTDLPDRLDLLRKNVAHNMSALSGSIEVTAVDWCSPSSSYNADILLMVDCIYYVNSIEPLINFLSNCHCSSIICSYEKRDIGEPVKAQKLFFDSVADKFSIDHVPDSELDPEYCCSQDIPVFKLSIKLDMVRDPCTFSNYEELDVESYDFNWNVDFERKTLTGSVNIRIKAKVPTQTLVLDGRDLAIHTISIGDQILKHEIELEEVRGQKIKIDIPKLTEGQELIVTIHYATAPEARALQFLAKEQTTDQKAPYLFSQCQAFHARSILPCMDTPSSKSSYTAKVGVPAGLTCLMSAIADKKEQICDRAVYSFYQKVPIPAYLIAIVVGHLEKREISDRVAVWSEPSMADAARFEFEDTESVLKVAEDIAGKYVWGRYDMVVLPATFPFGGMENPCLTFITPTIIAGDKSLVNVVAHEISHSWTGNLVTNASWEHFWLNEGFTVFLERKIHGRMFGELEREFESEKGFDEALVPTVREIFGPVHEFTKLVQNQSGIDPDDAFSSIPYEKGSAFLIHIDQILGDSERFEKFIRAYIAKYAYKSVTTLMWKTELYDFFNDKKAELDSIDWDLWLYQPGVPPKPRYDSTLMNACRELAKQWTSATPPADASTFLKMGTSQKISVLETIRSTGKFEQAKMPPLTDLYQLSTTKNCEIKFSWLMLGLESKWEPIVVPALSFALAIGRLKYCKPIYKALFNWPVSQSAAVDQFKKNIPFMHPITVNVISKFLPK